MSEIEKFTLAFFCGGLKLNYIDSHIHIASCKNVLEDLKFFETHNYTAWSNCQNIFEFNQTCRIQEEINLKFPNVKILKTYGVHPWHVTEVESDKELNIIDNLLAQKKIDAVGEIGFDCFTPELKQTLDVQKFFFEAQLDLALKYNVPVIIHNRKAWDLNFSYWQKLKKLPQVVFHCFAFTKDQALSLLNKNVNAYFSFSNIKGHKKIEECIKGLPKERIRLETDAPFNHSSLKEIAEVYEQLNSIC